MATGSSSPTVVRHEPPSSYKAGDTALITQGGAFHGWLGGSCIQPAVVREALRALADGAPRLIALAPEPLVDALAHLGLTHIDIPITPEKVWRILRDKGVALYAR